MTSPKTNITPDPTEDQSLWRLLETYDSDKAERVLATLLFESIGKHFVSSADGSYIVPLHVDFSYAVCLYEGFNNDLYIRRCRIGEIGLSL